jgi:hypothetical protein
LVMWTQECGLSNKVDLTMWTLRLETSQFGEVNVAK